MKKCGPVQEVNRKCVLRAVTAVFLKSGAPARLFFHTPGLFVLHHSTHAYDRQKQNSTQNFKSDKKNRNCVLKSAV